VDEARSEFGAELARAGGSEPLAGMTFVDITQASAPHVLTPAELAAAAALHSYVERGPAAPQRAPIAAAAAAQGSGGMQHNAAAAPQDAAAMAQQVLAAAQHDDLGGAAANAPGPVGNFVRAARVLQAAYQRINANADLPGSAATMAASVANVAARNFAAVFVPTAIRQFLSYGLEAAMHNASDTTRTIAGAAAPVLAVGALVAGAVRDRMEGTNTPTSERSRAIMGGAITTVGIAAAATGSMAHAAPLLLAFTAYTAMRDLLVQSAVRLNNAHTQDYTADPTHLALISTGYGIDQALVDLAMSTRASPSGMGAFNQHAGVQVANAFARAGINWAGEVGEDLMYEGIEMARSHLDPDRQAHDLQLSLSNVGYQRNNVLNGAMGPWAVRTGILSTTIGLTQMLSDHASNPSFTNHPLRQAAASALIIGAVNALLYEPFRNSSSGQPTGLARDASNASFHTPAASADDRSLHTASAESTSSLGSHSDHAAQP
jgi:hypothetical protein